MKRLNDERRGKRMIVMMVLSKLCACGVCPLQANFARSVTDAFLFYFIFGQ
jgi:hypothetical protein